MGYELEVQKIKKFWFCYFENKILMNSDQMQQLFSEQVFLKSYCYSLPDWFPRIFWILACIWINLCNSGVTKTLPKNCLPKVVTFHLLRIWLNYLREKKNYLIKLFFGKGHCLIQRNLYRAVPFLHDGRLHLIIQKRFVGCKTSVAFVM